MRLGTVFIVLALGWASVVHAQQPTTAIHPLGLNAKAVLQPAPGKRSGDKATQKRGFTDADIVRIAGFDPRTHVLAVAGKSNAMKVVVWDRRQPRATPGVVAAEIGSLNLGNTPSAAAQSRTMTLVTATLRIKARSGNGSIVLKSTGVARLTKDGAGKLNLAPVAGGTGIHGNVRHCRAHVCASGPLKTVNVTTNFRKSIGSVQNPALDSDGDGFTDDVDQCPGAADQGYGVDAYGCPIWGSPDSDGDGFTDDVDQCPAAADQGYGMDPYGCPITGNQDSDGDGLPDVYDSCPGQGDAGYGVDANGCPNVDSDGDGVFDAVDQCPGRGEEGYGVNYEGCPNPPAPQDYDYDGVTDDVDQCFAEGDTYGYGVYPNGCPIMDSDWDGYADPYDSCPDAGDAGYGLDGSGCPLAPG